MTHPPFSPGGLRVRREVGGDQCRLYYSEEPQTSSQSLER